MNAAGLRGPEQPTKTVCAWCRHIMAPGKEPASHGICQGCADQYFPKVHEPILKAADTMRDELLKLRNRISRKVDYWRREHDRLRHDAIEAQNRLEHAELWHRAEEAESRWQDFLELLQD